MANPAGRRPGLNKPWVKGEYGNKSGTSAAVLQVKRLALEYCPRAIGRLVALMDSGDERVALHAATAILDRGVGKPKAHLDATIRPHEITEITDVELVAIASAGRARDVVEASVAQESDPVRRVYDGGSLLPFESPSVDRE